MVTQRPNPFGTDRERQVRARIGEPQVRLSKTVTRTGSSRMERFARRAGAWAAQSRLRPATTVYLAAFGFFAALTRPARDLTAKLKRSDAAQLAIMTTIWVASIIYLLATGQSAGIG